MKNVTVRWIEQEGEFEATSAEHPMFSASAPTAEEAVHELRLVTRGNRPVDAGLTADFLPANSSLLRIRAPRAFHRAVKRAAAQRDLSVEKFAMAALVRAMQDAR